MSILYAISIVYIAGEYDGPGFCTPIGVLCAYYNTTQQLLLIYCIRIRQVFGIPFLQKNYYNVTYIDSKYIHTICNIEQQEQIINQYSNIRYFRIYTYHIITVISRIKRTSIATIWQNKQMHKLVYIHLY